MKQEFVTLPRSVVEWALDAFETDDWQKKLQAAIALRAALEQTQNQSGGIPPNWKLVPVEPTRGMIEAGKDAHYEAEKRIQQPDAWKQGGFAKRAVRAAHVFQAMLDAAPQPQALDQPQANQPAMTPIAQRKLEDLMASGYTISGYSVYREQKHQHGFVTGAGLVGWWKPDGVEYPQPPTTEDCSVVQPQVEKEPFAWISPRALEWGTRQSEKVVKLTCEAQPEYDFTEPLYTRPQPKREPPTDDQIDAIADAMPGGLEGFLRGCGWRQFARAVIEATNNIK